MPYITCEKTKQKKKTKYEVCIHFKCKWLKIPKDVEKPMYCGYESKSAKLLAKRKSTPAPAKYSQLYHHVGEFK